MTSGHCDGCDSFVRNLIRKGGLYLCLRCLAREL